MVVGELGAFGGTTNTVTDLKAQELQQVLGATESGSIPHSSLLLSAKTAYDAGNVDEGRKFALQFIQENESLLQIIEDQKTEKHDTRELLRYMIATQPEGVRHGLSLSITRLSQIAWKIYTSSTEEKLDTLGTIGRTLAFRRNAMQGRAISALSDSLLRLSAKLSSADQALLLGFADKKGDLFFRLGQALDALASRWGTCEDRALDISRSIDRFIATGRFYESNREEGRTLSAFIERERGEQIRKEVIFTRENAALGVATALAVAEVGCAFATGGLCLAAAPGLMGTTMTIVRGGARAYAAVSAVADITDRFRFDGALGTVSSFGFWVDLLVIASVTPRPTMAMMKWAPQIPGAGAWINQGLSHFRPGLALALAQHQSGYLLMVGGTGYGIWQMKYAERISREMALKGIEISALDVRRKGAVSIALAMVGGLTMYYEYRKGVALYGEEYEKMMAPARAGTALKRVGAQLAKLMPWNPPVSFVRNIRQWTDAPVLNSLRALGNLGAIGYNILFWTNTTLLGVAYGDWSFNEKAAPLPDLKDGEIALVLNGFADTDLLYYGFASEYAVRRESEKYGASLYRARFGSPAEMISQIEAFGKIGKIRYLAIETHGLPGRLYAQAPGPEGGSEFMDAKYMQENSAKISGIMKAALARDTNVRLVSCLVGANFDQAEVYQRKNGEKIAYPKDAGDRFMKAFGSIFMVNGGTVDSSRRMILGADALYGSFFNDQLESLMENPATRAMLNKQAETLKTRLLANPALALLNEDPSKVSDDDKEGAKGEVVMEIFEHLKATYGSWNPTDWQIYEVIRVYGMKVAGGPLSEKHRRDVFPAQP
jgi:hypothetical protein